jgi:hypothetical protein
VIGFTDWITTEAVEYSTNAASGSWTGWLGQVSFGEEEVYAGESFI